MDKLMFWKAESHWKTVFRSFTAKSSFINRHFSNLGDIWLYFPFFVYMESSVFLTCFAPWIIAVVTVIFLQAPLAQLSTAIVLVGGAT